MFYNYDDDFFEKITKPAIQPPKWIFKYVWSVLFLLMLVSFFIIVLKPQTLTKYLALVIFFLQLAVNLYWTRVFFKEHNIKKAFITAVILTILVAVMLVLFFRLSFLGGFLQIPYFLWLIFACVLNKLLLDMNT